MVIKPLEKTIRRGLGLKIGFLFFLIAFGFVLNKVVPRPASTNALGVTETKKNEQLPIEEEATKFIKKTTDNLINDTVGAVTALASQSAETVSNTVITNTVINVIRQIDKLAPKQQEEIKKAICQ